MGSSARTQLLFLILTSRARSCWWSQGNCMLIYFEFSVCLLCSIDINIAVGQLPLGNIYRQQTMPMENSVEQSSSKGGELLHSHTAAERFPGPGAEQSHIWALLGTKPNPWSELTSACCHLAVCCLLWQNLGQLRICCGTCYQSGLAGQGQPTPGEVLCESKQKGNSGQNIP